MSVAVRTRPLIVLTAVVLAAHAVLLRAAPASVQPSARHAPAFLARTLADAPVAPVAAVVPPEAKPLAQAPPASPVRKSAPRYNAAPDQPRVPPALTLADVEVIAVASALTAQASTPAPTQAAPAAHVPTAFQVPASMRLRYKVDVRLRGIPLSGEGLLTWRVDGDAYDARLDVSSALYGRTQRSTGRVTSEGLAPTRFSDKGRSEEAAHFERDKGRVTFSSNKPEAALLAGAQDRLSVILQLGAMMAGDPPKYPAGTAVTIQTAGTRESEAWMFTVEATEELDLPGGKVRAVKLVRNPRKEFDHRVELWLAPGMAYAPVRLRLTQPNGDWVDQQWSSTDRG